MDTGQPMRTVIGVTQAGAVRQGEQRELADAVVLVGGGFGADRLAGHPAAGVIGEGRRESIGIDRDERPAVGVIRRDLRHMPQGISDRGEIAAFAQVRIIGRVVGVGGEVDKIGAGAVGGEDLTIRVVTPGLGARGAGGCGSEALAASGVGGGLFDLLAQDADGDTARARGGWDRGTGRSAGDGRSAVAVAVVDEGGEFQGFGKLDGQPPDAVPLGADRTGYGSVAGLYPLCFEVPRQVVGVGRDVAVEVGAGRYVAVGIIGLGTRGRAAARTAGLGGASAPHDALHGSEGVGAGRPQGVGDGGAVGAETEGRALGAAGVFGENGPPLAVVAVGGVSRAVLVGDAGQVVGEAGVLVVIAAAPGIGPRDAGEVVGSVIAELNHATIGLGQCRHPVLCVVGQGQGMAEGIGDRGQASAGIVAQRLRPALCVGDALQLAASIVGFDLIRTADQLPTRRASTSIGLADQLVGNVGVRFVAAADEPKVNELAIDPCGVHVCRGCCGSRRSLWCQPPVIAACPEPPVSEVWMVLRTASCAHETHSIGK